LNSARIAMKSFGSSRLWRTVGVLAACGFGFAAGMLIHADKQTHDVRSLDELPQAQLRAFLKGFPGDWRDDTGEARGRPAPDRVKPIPTEAVTYALVPPEQFTPRDLAVTKAIAERRSQHAYTEEPLTFEELSVLLWHTQGVTGHAIDAEGQPVSLRAAPSGGARYPLETYVFVHRVENLEPGLYRFAPESHQLVEITRDPDMPRALQRACFDAPFTGAAAAVIAFTAVPRRTEWKYGYIAHRMIAYEAGHAAQNVYLSAAAIGAGACAIAAYHQPSLDDLLNVDGEEEFALYLVAVGKVADPTRNGAPQ